MSNVQKYIAKEYYNAMKDDFTKNWDDLTDIARDLYYTKYAKENGLINEDAKTYEQYMENDNLETFVSRYKSKSGDEIVAFGQYGYDD